MFPRSAFRPYTTCHAQIPGERIFYMGPLLSPHMDLRVHGSVPASPFEEARSRLEPAHDIEKPIDIEVSSDPDERTWTGHHPDRHVLSLSRQAATSAMATELALHEFAHMRRAEEAHPSHTIDTQEVLFLALAGNRVRSEAIPHAYQIANHIRDVYADDITLAVSSGEKLAAFLEAELVAAIRDRPGDVPRGGYSLSRTADPALTVVNAAFALALLDRHEVAADHRIEDLADVAERDAPGIDLRTFRHRFRSLQGDPTEQECLRTFVDTIGAYFTSRGADPASAAD